MIKKLKINFFYKVKTKKAKLVKIQNAYRWLGKFSVVKNKIIKNPIPKIGHTFSIFLGSNIENL